MAEHILIIRLTGKIVSVGPELIPGLAFPVPVAGKNRARRYDSERCALGYALRSYRRNFFPDLRSQTDEEDASQHCARVGRLGKPVRSTATASARPTSGASTRPIAGPSTGTEEGNQGPCRV